MKSNKRKIKNKKQYMAQNMHKISPKNKNGSPITDKFQTTDARNISHRKETEKAHSYTQKNISSAAKASSVEIKDPYKKYERCMAGLSPTTKELIREEIPHSLELQEKARLRRIRNKPIPEKEKRKAIRESTPIVHISKTPTSSTNSTNSPTNSLKSSTSSDCVPESHRSMHQKVQEVMRPIFTTIGEAWSTFRAFRHTPKILPTTDLQNQEN